MFNHFKYLYTTFLEISKLTGQSTLINTLSSVCITAHDSIFKKFRIGHHRHNNHFTKYMVLENEKIQDIEGI